MTRAAAAIVEFPEELCYACAMSLAQLEYFVAVAEEGHLSRAAARLHISQPPLTRQVQSLEAELGIQLFERTARGMRLLPVGHQLLERAREILKLVDATRKEVSAWSGEALNPGAL